MKYEFGYVHWLGEKDCLSCQGGLIWASSPTEFSANGGMCLDAHAPGGISPSFPLQPKTADTIKVPILPVNMTFCFKNKGFSHFFPPEFELVIN